MEVDKLVPEAGLLAGFIEQFPVFVSAPGGIEKIKEMVLQLAVMGQLVENSLESSTFLLENLIKKKEVLIKSKILKRSKSLGEIAEDEKRFLIPDNWVWARASDIYDIRDGTHDSPKYQDNGFPLVTSKNIYSGKLDLTNVKYISEEDHTKISERSKVDKDDILFAMIGSIGNPVIIDIDPVFSVKNVGLFKYYDRSQSVPEFLLLFLKLAAVWMKEEASGAVQSFVSLGKLRSIPISLPPLEEQKRIVAKVDELMVLCDKLEAQQQQQANNVLRANAAAINALLNPESQQTVKSQKTTATVSVSVSKARFEQNWQRIGQYFNTLYGCTLPMPDGEGRKKKHLVGLENVRAMKRAILDLAIMGRLTAQNSDTEVAEVLLKKVSDEREQLIKKGNFKKIKEISVITEDEITFKIPNGWKWERLGNIAELINGDRGKNYPNKSEYVNDGIAFINTGHIEPDGSLSKERMNYISKEKYDSLRGGKIKEGDLVYCLRGATFGKTANVEGFKDGAIASSLMIIRLSKEIEKRYFYFFLVSPFGQSLVRRFDNGSAQPNLSANSVKLFITPIPPIEEQKRIVAKVDQLMSLCDQLEQQLTQSYSDAEKLMQATVKALVA